MYIYKRLWSSGMIKLFQSFDPSSILGRRTFLMSSKLFYILIKIYINIYKTAYGKKKYEK